jgi:transcriptional regulator with XRE-family HTH domain
MAEILPEWNGLRLRELREGAGMSREALAERSGISIRSLEKWEQSVREPSWAYLQLLCRALGVSCEAFTQAPASQDKPGRGRPAKAKPEVAETEPKRLQGRPRKQAEEPKAKGKSKRA